MVVRVRVRIKPLKAPKGPVETVGIANAGFSSVVPEAFVPLRLAEKMGLWPALPEGTSVGTYGVAAGKEVQAHRIREAVEVQVLTKEKTSDPVKTTVAIVEGEREFILSDKALDELGIELLRPGAGIWRFRGEEKLRKSEKPKYW